LQDELPALLKHNNVVRTQLVRHSIYRSTATNFRPVLGGERSPLKDAEDDFEKHGERDEYDK
jgi:hypothetical protein